MPTSATGKRDHDANRAGQADVKRARPDEELSLPDAAAIDKFCQQEDEQSSVKVCRAAARLWLLNPCLKRLLKDSDGLLVLIENNKMTVEAKRGFRHMYAANVYQALDLLHHRPLSPAEDGEDGPAEDGPIPTELCVGVEEGEGVPSL